MTERRHSASWGLAAGLVIALIFIGGFGAGIVFNNVVQGSSEASDPGLREFLTAYHLVMDRSYYRPFNKQHLIYAAIDGMLSATGDPHTLFLSPDQNQVANTQLNGSQFSGIGAIVVPHGKSLEVLAPLPHSPSLVAGLHSGDIIVRVNGRAVSSMSGNEAVQSIHGRAGSTVALTIQRGNKPLFTARVHRAEIAPVTAYGRMLPHAIGYVQIFSFGDTTSKDVSDALTLLRSMHARAIVLDLRDNPGGYVDAAQQVVSQFVPQGIVAYEQTPDKHLQALPIISQSHTFSVPIAVLVNEGTASAAEITAGALRDDLHAVLVGTRTYGKGSMQSVYSLSDGSSIRITDRLWLTPKKHSIQNTGLKPNISVQDGSGPNPDTDGQLQAAERYLERHTAS